MYMWFASGTAFATSVAVILHRGHIAAAADTLGLVGKENKWGKDTHCKIHSTRREFFAFAGIVKDDDTKFDAIQIAMKALNGQGNLNTRVKTLTANIHDPLLRVVKRVQRELKPGEAEPLISGFRPILQLVVFGYENGVPSVDTVDFALKNNGYDPITINPIMTFCPGDSGCPLPGDTGIHLSMIGESKAAIKAANEGVLTGNDFDDARRLISIEISAMPKDVGPPIDVLSIDAIGTKWIAPYGACAQPTSTSKITQDKKKQR